MIWATTSDIRAYPEAQIPADYDETLLQHDIDRAVRSLERKILRWPALDPDTDRAVDAEVRRHIVAAVGEVIGARRTRDAQTAELGALAGIVEDGGRVKAGKLEVDGTASSGGSKGVGYGREKLLPWPAVEALAAAGLIGGGVASW